MTKTGNHKRVPHNLPSQRVPHNLPSQRVPHNLPSRSDDLCQVQGRALGIRADVSSAVAQTGIQQTGPLPRPKPTRGMIRWTRITPHPLSARRGHAPPKNPKHEIRNPKQIQMSEIQMTKTENGPRVLHHSAVATRRTRPGAGRQPWVFVPTSHRRSRHDAIRRAMVTTFGRDTIPSYGRH